MDCEVEKANKRKGLDRNGGISFYAKNKTSICNLIDWTEAQMSQIRGSESDSDVKNCGNCVSWMIAGKGLARGKCSLSTMWTTDLTSCSNHQKNKGMAGGEASSEQHSIDPGLDAPEFTHGTYDPANFYHRDQRQSFVNDKKQTVKPAGFEDRADRTYEHQPHPISGAYGASADVSTTEWCEAPLIAKVCSELEAASKIIKSLEGLDGDSASRVMSYVVDLLDMHI
jgi:hypothetical protein